VLNLLHAVKPGRGPSLLLVFALAWAAVLLAHLPLLALPYWWDEAGYYIPAAYDFFRTGALIPHSTLSNAHPPLPSVYLATAWHLFGYAPVVTRVAMCAVAAAALTAVFRIAQSLLPDRRSAVAVTLLTALYPVWFVQSTLAHADLLAAAFTLWGLALYFGGSRSLAPTIACFSLAALSKETAITYTLLLAAREAALALRPHRGAPRQSLRRALLLLTPALPLAGWYAFHRVRTGYTFGNPTFLHYNATSTLAPARIAMALVERAFHLTAHLNLFVPVLITLGALAVPRRGAWPLRHTRTLAALLLAHWLLFSVVGGALLTRYLLPLYPLLLLLCVGVWVQRLRRPMLPAGFTAAAFSLGFLVNPPYRFAPEDTLAYRDAVVLEQHAISVIAARYGHPSVLTAWPASDALSRPELGYTAEPFPVVPIDNFSLPELVHAAQLARSGDQPPFSTVLLFSTKYQPPHSLASALQALLPAPLARRKQQLDEQYFGLHYDLPPAAAARLLDADIVWQQSLGGQWAAVLRLHRGATLAYAVRPAPRPPL
jgi:4-amino-4-deoxy-L-arabinose transferase-like glycosyltransferase